MCISCAVEAVYIALMPEEAMETLPTRSRPTLDTICTNMSINFADFADEAQPNYYSTKFFNFDLGNFEELIFF